MSREKAVEKSRERIANRVSDIFNPYYSSIVFFLIVSLAAARTFKEAMLYWAVTGLFFSLLPILDIRRRIKKGLVGDAHISRREDRIMPFLVSLGCAVLGLVAVYAINAPAIIKAVSWSVVATGAIIIMITSVWKISLHAAGITSIATVFIILFGAVALPALMLIPLVYWARLTLKKHTIAQLLAGSTVSVFVVLGIFASFGLLSTP